MQVEPSQDTQSRSKNGASGGKVEFTLLSSGAALIKLGGAEEGVVTLNAPRMESLLAAVQRAKTEKVKGLIIAGPSSKMFCAGADIHTIKDVTDCTVAEKLAKEGQELFDLLESLPCITVAAISGPCVGGACEMVLACNYRLISSEDNSVIGLPEVKLGILPGFGGTQRLPRLIGLPKALDIILAGKTLRPSRALSTGLVDEILSYNDLQERAERIALGKAKVKMRTMGLLDRFLTYSALGRKIVKVGAAKKLKKVTKGFYPAPPAALKATLFGLERGTRQGFANEAKELGRLLVTPESKALVNVFFLTEGAKAIGKTAKATVKHWQTVVIGSGVMGAGLAHVLARNKCQVILKDTSDANLARGMNQIETALEKLKYLNKTDRSFILNRIEITTKDSANTGNANFAIEAVFEDLELKKSVLGEIARLVPEDTLIATNTSSLSVTEIASAIHRPERVVGMHFFNPVDKMPLVEIIRGAQTSDKAVVVTAALASKLGKFPIVVDDVPGFLVNRILSAYLNEAAYLLKDGYAIRDIDKAALKFGLPMGPLRLLDEVGLDVATRVAEVMVQGYGERMQGPNYVLELFSAGRKGKKSGLGFYKYADGNESADAEIYNLLKLPPPQ
ncbi:3-hydroxyacyl-CoA dehydrogenase NAD-binding domain-containing protein [Oligoflexia bacterium]|nr:3-hydroxyacyl-CoA dehydrogenase NAD-binding domain-containing protein [Oligoflexia bacterium]